MAEKGWVGEWVKAARKHAQLTQSTLAARLSKSALTIARWEKGERIPKGDELFDISKTTGYPLPSTQYDEPSNVRGSFKELIRLPILSSEITACCGDGTPLLELTTRTGNFFYFPKDRIGRIDDLRPPFGIDAEGDSMAGYGVFDGALVAVNPAEDLRSGHIAVVCIGDRVAIKKIYFKPNGIELKSSDGRPPTQISPEDIECGWFKVLGKVMGTVSGVDEEP